MKRWVFVGGLVVAGLFGSAGLAVAARAPVDAGAAAPAVLPGIKIAPLKYQTAIELGHSKAGFIDVSNPTGSKVHLKSQVQAFRQIDQEGDLEFFDDAAISGGIQVANNDFVLGPREAARISFTIDPNRLPHGGVYAAVFFRTLPDMSSSQGTQVFSSARVGTLLILDVGGKGQTRDQIVSIRTPWFAWGDAISGKIEVRNNGNSRDAVAFNPRLAIRPDWLAPVQYVNGPLIFPGNQRPVDFRVKGNYIGPMYLTATDVVGGGQKAHWVLAITGYWRWISLVLVALVLAWLGMRTKSQHK